ncbi:MAG TPA: hypothetical protein VH302_02655 [Bryobacteraceae bacterium]|nr:hypothetical protein [Bryobacteraceae bacterium]
MPDIEITDDLGTPVESIKPDLESPSSLFNYVKAQLLHLAVAPDFMQRKDSLLTKVAPQPIDFKAKFSEKFQLGTTTQPAICFTPGCAVDIDVDATSKELPANTGSVKIHFIGSLDAGISETSGDLTFGFDAASTVELSFAKAFPLGAGEPTLGNALAESMSSFVIPATVADLEKLGVNDEAIISGAGSLKVSAGVKVTAIPNPLASVALPLSAGTLSLNAGPAVALTTSFEVSGKYEIKARGIDAETCELTISPQHGTTFKADLAESAGVAGQFGTTDVTAMIVGAVSVDPAKEAQALADLDKSQRDAVTDAIKSGLSHSLQACLQEVLSVSTDEKPAFQYRVQPARLSADAATAVNRALKGDLSLLTATETKMQKGVLAPGLTMMQSLASETSKRGLTLKLNLIGILNYVSVADLIRHSEVVTDEVSGDVTIKDAATSNRISAIVNQADRHEALRKVMFDSVLATASYRAAKAVVLPAITCEQVHLAVNKNADSTTVNCYLHWLEALNLMTTAEEKDALTGFAPGKQLACVLRTGFAENDCDAMFFDGTGKLYPQQHYLEIGRQALLSLLDVTDPVNKLRARLLSDGVWPQAVSIGAVAELGDLVGVQQDDSRVLVLIGDVYDISFWAEAMVNAGQLIDQVRKVAGNSDPKVLIHNPDFNAKRQALQKKLADMVKTSKMRFDQPWGMLCLYRAAGAPPFAYAKITGLKTPLERGVQRTLAAGG